MTRPEDTTATAGRDRDRVAVIGFAGRFPGASTAEEFWRLLREGREAHTEFTPEQLRAAGVPDDLLDDPRLVRRRPVLDGVERFDAAFFGYTPREAELLDPQQRLFLECSWEALESAGWDPTRFDGAIGVFGGGGPTSYWQRHLAADPRYLREVGEFQALLGNEKDFTAPRVSYKLDLRGPSVSVLSGCSSSLVAVHLAVQSLLDGESDMALAGGATVYFPQHAGYVHTPGGVNSPDGHCRAFAADAAGTVPGDGAGVVLLKRLEDALADGDRVHGVLLGTAVNNDGALKAGFTAPSVRGQADVVIEALAVAGAEPGTVSYVETHGTGTPLGDGIEVAALTEAFGSEKRGHCTLGTLKPNIGHTDTAAGILGLIKVLLAFRHEEIPPALHSDTPHPDIDFPATPFRVSPRVTPWPRTGEARRAGVSSFSVGGTNAHVILEEPPPAPEPAGTPGGPELLVLSARTPTALQRSAEALAAALRADDAPALADAAHTLRAGRRAFPHRLAVVARDRNEAAAALDGTGITPVTVGHADPSADPAPAFLFPGQGSQRVGMGRGLYATEPGYRDVVDECAELLVPLLGEDLRTVLFPDDDPEAAAERLTRTRLAQPALFVTQYALARLLESWGVRPAAMLGHSVGEFTAACLAGVLTLPDALRVVARRGELVDRCAPGAMAAVPLPADHVRELIADDARLAVAVVNAPDQTVVSGPPDAVQALVARLTAAGTDARTLHTSHAFHSPAMDPAVTEFTATVAGVRLAPPATPFLSCVTGTWITPEQATDPAYWGRQLREPVLFGDALRTLRREPGRLPLEVGAGNTLRALASRAAAPGQPPVIPTLGTRHDAPDAAPVLEALGHLWTRGVPFDATVLTAGESRRRVPLPTYPFERQRFFVDLPAAPAAVPAPAALAPDAPEPAADAPPAEEAPALTGYARPDLPTPYTAPRTPLEETVAGVWQEVMGVTPVGAHDNFFDLGGHSLMAAQVVARLQAVLPVTLTMTDLLAETQTVAGTAATVERRLHEKLAAMSDDDAARLLSE
ncbi:type I polyketide synthase [Streptomyces mobaraensis]|uniref:Acyltransferase domain-containing protein n=1 Tax=Streptomyces mobaraensis TaxID=35621 RepID=A0A5N5W2Q0_STRMB|nr:type I polyketide synthase [Streptomyces mobaraensis]KAB7836966.1 acyltransferase domain-containing protein [Streptomyces mobaraensis]